MKVVVDTSIWSLALRRKKENLNSNEENLVKELIELINEGRVILIGPIRQEILSGITDLRKFNQLKSKLIAFSDFQLTTNDFEKAAEFFNNCRAKGVQGSHIDFLICAFSFNHNFSIFTTDLDFYHYSECLKLNLYKMGDIDSA
jgi:hypothetical protein